MYAIHHILVAIRDPRASSHPVVAKAAAIAMALDAKLQLFHAIDTPIYPDLGVADELALRQLESRHRDAQQLLLEGIAAPLRRHGLTVTTAVEWDFPRHEAIIRSAARFGANLIVAAGHATAHHLTWLPRYTDWELLRASAVPVLLVKNPRPYRRPVVLAALDPTRAFGKPADLDNEILRFSATLAAALQGRVHLVHGYVPVPANLSLGLLGKPDNLEQILAATQAEAFDALSKQAQPLGIANDHLHAVARHPTDAVLEVAQETHSQIVTLGSISRSGVRRFFLGNTAEALIDQLECDVLVVKPSQFRHRVAREPRGVKVVPPAVYAGGI